MKANYKTDNKNKANINIELLNQKKKKWNLFKLEDLLIIEEKMLTLIEYIKYNKEIFKQCFDIFNYFYNSSLFKKLENIFNTENYINIAKLNIKFGLISLIIIYEYSFNKNIFIQTKNELKEIIEANYNNLCLIKQQIINDLMRNNYDKDDNSWIKYLLKDINNISINLNEDNTFLLISYIEQNNQKIYYKLYNLLNYFSFTENNNKIKNILLQLKTKSYDDINNLMKINILKIDNIEGSLIASLFLRNNSIFSPINPPYIKVPLISKKYTLVLDLDETLVNFKIKSGKEGYVRLRPFLLGFLEEVSQYYELIIFTSATEAYANSVIEAIEKEKKYFDFIFYRQHTIIIGNDFVKDLTRIGRPLNSTIIIDNTPQNFRFQKENGICVKPFWGQDTNDKTLYNLIPILIDIAKMGGDIRINLNKFKEEIVSKITSNIN
jgi:Dullard-like phosphatase family protein